MNILIANSEDITGGGLCTLIASIQKNYAICWVKNASELHIKLKNFKPDIVFIDYLSDNFSIDDIQQIKTLYPEIKIISVTEKTNKRNILKALSSGVSACLLECCDKQEIKEAIENVCEGHQFFCGKILNIINEDSGNSCAGIQLSEREIEIITYIAQGLTAKEIADKLFLSTHTVNTHKKKIMQKLGVKNIAELVMFAVKEKFISPEEYIFSY